MSALALALRLAQVGFGLPGRYHPDEIQATAHVGRWLSGDLSPIAGMYRHPPLLRNAAWAGLAAARAIAPRTFAAPDHATITLALRLVSAISGALAVPALYLVARAVTSRRLALAAAAILAILPLHVVSSTYGVPDVLLSTLVIAGLALALRITRGAPPLVYFAAGLALALGFGAKYNAIFVAIPLALAHARAVRQGSERWLAPRPILAFAAGVTLGFTLSFPLLLRDPRALASDLLFEGDHLFVRGHEGFRLGGGDGLYVFHFLHSIPETTGPLLLGFMVGGLGLIVARCRKQPELGLLLSFVAPYYVAMEQVFKIPPNFERYVLPLAGLYVLAAVLAGEALAPAAAKILGRRAPRPWIAVLVFTAALGAFPAIRTARVLAGMRRDADTREAMRRYLADTLPRGARVVAPLAGAYYPEDPAFRFMHPTTEELSNRFSAIRGPREGERVARPVFVLASSLVYDRAFTFPDAQPELRHFYARLFAEGELLASFEAPGARYLYQNPTLRLYRMVDGRSP